MPTVEEKRGAGFHMVSEANGFRSREAIIVKQGEVLEVGTVLGKITAEDKYVQVDNVTPASDGSEDAACILWDKVDATDGDVEVAVHARDCEVNGNELIYAVGADQGQQDAVTAQLEALEIIVRL